MSEYIDGKKNVLDQLFNQQREMLIKRMHCQFQREMAITQFEIKAEYAKKLQEFTDKTVVKFNVSIKIVVFYKTP